MKRPSQQKILHDIFFNVFEREFNANSMDDRVMLQKVVFFMHELGVYCGDYTFSWDCYGPFSPDLSDDMKKEIKEDIKVDFSEKSNKVMDDLKNMFNINSEYLKRYWVETLASLYYLKNYMYPTSTDNEIIQYLEDIKGKYLNKHSDNCKAINVLNNLFAE